MNTKKDRKHYLYSAPLAGMLLLVVAVIFYQGWHAGMLWGAVPSKMVEGVPKDDIVLDDDDRLTGVSRRANVLFLLDTGSAMTFAPDGKMPEVTLFTNGNPDWPTTYKKLSDTTVTLPTAQAQTLSLAIINDRLAKATYGAGGLSLTGTLNAGAERFGRDVDTSNNVIGSADCYYTSDPAKPYLLTFRTLSHGNWGGTGTKPSGWPAGLTSYLPGGADSNKPVPASLVDQYMMPNDSRMYQMKLVMWRLLSDATLFENLRFGMATTYQGLTPASHYIADFYKASPFGKTTTYPNGTGPDWATGLTGSNGYTNSQSIHWGIDRQVYTPASNNDWKYANRAYLRVPIDSYSATHVEKFRMWIDGVEDNTPNAGTLFYLKNPELVADGKTPLAMAIYPGNAAADRNWYVKNSGVQFSQKGTSGYTFYHSNITVDPSNTGTYFKKGDGEAVGTVLDFFSPPVGGKGGVISGYDGFNYNSSGKGTGTGVETAPDISFPLHDKCDKNWLIIFTAGDDSGDYPAEQAVADLYTNTKAPKLLTKLESSGSTNSFEEIMLEDGVRTLVVGFVDRSDPTTAELRTRLNKMAVAGDPGNPQAKAYFANNVPELISVMRSIMERINSEMQPAKGPMTESDSFEMDAADSFNLFSAGYKISSNDQWQGEMTRYESKVDGNGKLTVQKKWELGASILNQCLASPPSRNVVYWDGGSKSFKRMDFTSSLTDSSPHPQAGLMGLEGTVNLSSNILYSGKLHPSRAMVNWLYGSDYSYDLNAKKARPFVLSDFGQSGTILLEPPSRSYANLPGYNDWANTMVSRDIRLFAQTNDGILHVVDPKLDGGSSSHLEKMAIVPPPVLQPFRLALTKFSINKESGEMKANWRERYESKAAYILDGPLVSRNFNMTSNTDGTGWGTFLIGMLGRAGSGFYAMDITKPDAIQFLWYRETKYDDDGYPIKIAMNASDAAPTFTKDTNSNINISKGDNSDLFKNNKIDSYPYYQLGYNMPKPALGVARLPGNGYANIIALASGFQEKLDLSKNGYVGAALYIVDPKDGSVLRTFNSGYLQYKYGDTNWRVKNGSIVGVNPYMGMLISQPTLVQSEANQWTTGRIVTADNRGNIFMVQLEDSNGGGARSASDWALRTIASLRLDSEVGSSANHCIPAGLLVTRTSPSSPLWIAGGTANASTRHNDEYDSALIKNDKQYIFASKVPSDDYRMFYRSDWKSLTVSADSTIGGSDNGWYIRLKAEDSQYGEEYVTTRPVAMNGDLYCATFTPSMASISSCSGKVDGYTRLYAVDIATAGSNWKGSGRPKYIELDGVKVTGLTYSSKGGKETIIGTYVLTNEETGNRSLEEAANRGDINLVDGLPAFTWGTGSRTDLLPPLSTYINYWKGTTK